MDPIQEKEMDLIKSTDEIHPANLIPELCKIFWSLGWVTGTGGGISIKQGNNIYIAPSGVQKERMIPEHLFVVDQDGNVIRRPNSIFNLKPSQCTPLFFNAYKLRNAGACIHTHSQHAVMVTMLFPEAIFTITHQEMIKGIKDDLTKQSLQYWDKLIVPIIENTAHEQDLQERMQEAMAQHPSCSAVLVRRHGLYVWGSTWVQAKTMVECYDYLFELAIKMHSAGIDPSQVPPTSEYQQEYHSKYS